MRQRKPKPVWISLDQYDTGSAPGCCDVWLRRPKRITECAGFSVIHESVDGHSPVSQPCAGDFERVTGFHLEPGECVRVTISVERVQPKKRKAKA